MSVEGPRSGGRPRPAARLGGSADVAVELAALQRDVHRLNEIVRESTGYFAETIPRVGTLEEHVAECADRSAACSMPENTPPPSTRS